MRRLLIACLSLLAFAAPLRAEESRLLVFAAASLRESLDAAARQWQADGGTRVVVSYAGTAQLARQLERGAEAGMFISADVEWMDFAQRHGSIRADSRVDLLRNALVLVAPAGSEIARIDLGEADGLRAALGDGRLALAETTAIPAGRYARQSLEALGHWHAVGGRLVQGDNVRAALEYVARGDAALGIVYRSDALAEPRVRVVADIPPSSHAPIVYPAAATGRGDEAAARAFLTFLRGPRAAKIFCDAGFQPIE